MLGSSMCPILRKKGYEVVPANFMVSHFDIKNIAYVCQQLSLPMLYVSTIGVFYGDKKEPYNEFDAPRPANKYGWSKLEGEKVVQQLLTKFYIVRAGWMMGGGPDKDKKFIGKMVKQVKENGNILAVNDKIGSPTYVVDFSNVVA